MTSLGIIVESVTINTLWHQTSEIQILEIKKNLKQNKLRNEQTLENEMKYLDLYNYVWLWRGQALRLELLEFVVQEFFRSWIFSPEDFIPGVCISKFVFRMFFFGVCFYGVFNWNLFFSPKDFIFGVCHGTKFWATNLKCFLNESRMIKQFSLFIVFEVFRNPELWNNA